MKNTRKTLTPAFLICLSILLQHPPFVKAADVSFTFFAGGDTGYGGTYSANLNMSAASHGVIQPAFFLQLGDIAYNGTSRGNPGYGNEGSWCSFVKAHVHERLGNENYPYELISGNHENTATMSSDGFIGNSTLSGFKTCLPNKIGTIHYANEVPGTIPGACNSSVQCYAYEYYFDYPQENTIARFIGLSANLTIRENGVAHKYNYCDAECPTQSTSKMHLKWLNDTITGSQKAGYWAIVFFHKPCISVGNKACEGGGDLLDTLIKLRVDLVLTGHDHLYQRSKQLTCRGPIKATSSQEAVYDPGCIADDGSDGVYLRGKGMVQVGAGHFGGGAFTPVTVGDSELDYFARAMGGSTSGSCCWKDGASWEVGAGSGLLKISVTQTGIIVEQLITSLRKSVSSGDIFSDSFMIRNLETPLFVGILPAIIASGAVLIIAVLVVLHLRARRRRKSDKTKQFQDSNLAHSKSLLPISKLGLNCHLTSVDRVSYSRTQKVLRLW